MDKRPRLHGSSLIVASSHDLVLKADSHVAVYRYENEWSYLHKNGIFIVTILILEHVLFRLCRKT